MLQYGSFGPDDLPVQECLGCAPLDSDFGSTRKRSQSFSASNG
jgi:hypothetical protein